MIALAAAVMLAGAATGGRTAELPDEAENYAAALHKILSTRGRTSLEPLFELALNTSPRLEAVLPDLSDAQFKAAREMLPGLLLKRDGTPLVRPSAKFFNDLARRKGTSADRAFFEIYSRTEPDTSLVFPAYVRQQGPEAGCTTYDGKLMADLYRAWLAFRTAHHDDYPGEAQGELDNLDAELLSGICACGSADATAAGLQAFVDALPDVPIAPKIRDRVAAIRSGRSNFRFNCRG
jgi:hypothetical protein